MARYSNKDKYAKFDPETRAALERMAKAEVLETQCATALNRLRREQTIHLANELSVALNAFLEMSGAEFRFTCGAKSQSQEGIQQAAQASTVAVKKK